MLVEFADYDPSARTPGIPLSALVFTLLGRGQDAGTSVSQLAFQHGSGWWEWAFYTGPVALLFLLVGSIAARRAAVFPPIVSMTAGAGPMKGNLAPRQARAKAAFSARKP